jgi:hypothetical protein
MFIKIMSEHLTFWFAFYNVLHIHYHSLQLTYIYWHSFLKQYHIQLYIRMYISEHSKSCYVLRCKL